MLFIENMYTYFVYIQVIVITLLKKEKGRILKYSGDYDIIIRGWQQRKEGVFIKTYQHIYFRHSPKDAKKEKVIETSQVISNHCSTNTQQQFANETKLSSQGIHEGKLLVRS